MVVTNIPELKNHWDNVILLWLAIVFGAVVRRAGWLAGK